jgi:hypothetical protein
METLLVRVKDPEKKDLLLALLAEFDFVEVGELLTGYSATDERPVLVGYDIAGSPVYADQFVREAAEDIEAAQRGEVISMEDYVKETKAWLGNTK